MVNKTQMLKGSLEGCVLKNLSDTPCYSHELCALLQQQGFKSISIGTQGNE
ncbi:MAG: transcriptional regulator [Firmicutes bacterium]|nr:transcriptional regulator [Bacillota bacterium]